MAVSQTSIGRSWRGTNASANRPKFSPARNVSECSIVRCRFHRSTYTPASGPTTTVATTAARNTPLVAAGAQLFPLPRTVATHSVTVVSNMNVPVVDTAEPYHRHA
jgi:hypothetical protein